MPYASKSLATNPSSPEVRRAAPSPARPLLKWAGGKRQLLPVFRAFYPERFERYIEPFLGSGAVFFDLHASGRLAGHGVCLADRNPDLIGCYAAVRDRTDEVLAALARLADTHARDAHGCYYAVRERFNRERARAGRAGAEPCTPAIAAMLIYLNRTGFNGLFRVNGLGAFNVPVGRYARPRIVDEALVRAAARALGAPGVRLVRAGFADAMADAGPGDFLYVDPPYAPLSPTSAFGAYTAGRFTAGDQQRLCDAVVTLAGNGAQVMLSNSSAPVVDRMYREAVAAGHGLALWAVPARRAINSRPGGRGPVLELLLTSLAPRGLAGLPTGLQRLA